MDTAFEHFCGTPGRHCYCSWGAHLSRGLSMIADISPDAPLIYLAGWAPRSNGPTRGVIHTRKRSERNKSVIRGATCLAANSRGYRRGRKYQNTARNAKAQEPNAFTYKSTGMSSRSKRPSSASMTRRTYPSTSSIPFFRASSAKYSRRLSICSPRQCPPLMLSCHSSPLHKLL